MTGQGGRSFDIIRQVTGNVINIFNKRQSVCTAPCDGWILKMHYQWTFWIFMGGFSTIWYSWFHRDVIQCVSHFSAESQVRLDYMNICLSYPFVWQVDGTKRYLLFYRWIHWAFLIIAGVYYIPRKMSKTSDNPKVKKLFEDLAITLHRYDNVEKENMERAARYVIFNQRTHNGLYYKYLICNVVALGIDILVFHGLDFLFQGKFMNYGIDTFPFNRNPRTFQDPMSKTFPPFVKCTLHKHVQLVDERTEEFGCHLTVMELYEKIFLFVWIWLIVLMVITSLYIIYLLLLWISFVRMQILRVSKPVHATNTVRSVVISVISNCKIGDIYLLYRLRQFFSHGRFYELLAKFSDTTYVETILNGVKIDVQSNNKGNGNQRRQNMAQCNGMNQGGGDKRYRGKPNMNMYEE